MPKLLIDMGERGKTKPRFEIDGVAIAQVRRATFETGLPGEMPKAYFELLNTEAVIKGDAEVQVVAICPFCALQRDRERTWIVSTDAKSAYEAYREASGPQDKVLGLAPFEELPDEERLRWEAVARAIRMRAAS